MRIRVPSSFHAHSALGDAGSPASIGELHSMSGGSHRPRLAIHSQWRFRLRFSRWILNRQRWWLVGGRRWSRRRLWSRWGSIWLGRSGRHVDLRTYNSAPAMLQVTIKLVHLAALHPSSPLTRNYPSPSSLHFRTSARCRWIIRWCKRMHRPAAGAACTARVTDDRTRAVIWRRTSRRVRPDLKALHVRHTSSSCPPSSCVDEGLDT